MAKQIQSIEGGLYILESIMFNKEQVTTKELARQLGVHKSTISHLTSTLIEQGYLRKIPGTNRLAIGPKVYQAGRATGLTGEQIMRVPPALETLAAATGETAHLAELRGRSVIYPVNRYPDKTLRVQTETGGVEAAHSTAVGKALLVGLTDQEVRVLYEGVDLQRFTERTVDSVETLLAELDRVRSGGCTADTGEQTPGTGCLAAPVRDARGMVVAAVGISGPESRVFADGEGPGEAVLACAAEIEKILAE